MSRTNFLRFATVVSAVLVIAGAKVEVASLPTTIVRSLTYLGKFSLPAGFEYAGRGLAYNAARNSLFASGFARSPMTAEVSIPAIGGTASILQPLTDPTEGKSGSVSPGSGSDTMAGGYLVSGTRLIVSAFIYYDNTGTTRLSHFVRPLSLSTTGQVTGPLQIGPLNAGFYGGYMADIPAEWQSALGGTALTGQAELSIISRTSFGPAAFAFTPTNITSTSAVPLVYYDSSHTTLGGWDHPSDGVTEPNPHPYFGCADEIGGLVFPQGTASVLFFGRHGTTQCYGLCSSDPTNDYKGTHGYPYQSVMIVYDANDLAAVKAGTKQPWAVVPVTKWVLPIVDPTEAYHVSGAAYDPATGRIYVGQNFEHGETSVIHVFKLPTGTATPASPSNVRIIQ
jgi:hypothetical protein